MCQLRLTLFLTPFHIRTIDTLLVRTDLHPKVHVALAKTPWKLILFFLLLSLFGVLNNKTS